MVADPSARSRNMRAIKAKDTAPERTVRKALHAAGFRYRLHAKQLPGRPDVTLAKHHAVIFVNGCFWHQHECAMFKMPTERHDFWREKLGANRARDARSIAQLLDLGWRVAIVWECALRGPQRLPMDEVTSSLVRWLRGAEPELTVRGKSIDD